MGRHRPTARHPRGAAGRRAFAHDRESFTDYSDYQDSGEARPQPKRDGAIRAARRLNRMERALAHFEADMAFDDPYVLADRRNLGEAFAGEVVAAEPTGS